MGVLTRWLVNTRPKYFFLEFSLSARHGALILIVSWPRKLINWRIVIGSWPEMRRFSCRALRLGFRLINWVIGQFWPLSPNLVSELRNPAIYCHFGDFKILPFFLEYGLKRHFSGEIFFILFYINLHPVNYTFWDFKLV